jgi:integrase
MQREAPKQKQKLLRSRFYRNYLMFRLGSLHGFRRGEMTGQRPEDAICRCVRCRAYRLHQKGKTLEQIADHIRRGLKETEFKIDEASRFGEHKIKPLPGMLKEHFKFHAGDSEIEEEKDGEIVRQTIPYGTLEVYGKGWARGRSEPKEIGIFDPLRTEINEYIEANKLKLEDRLFPVTGRQFANIVKQAAIVAGTPHAEAMAPHGLRRSFGTNLWRRLRASGNADPLVLRDAMRHADVKTSFDYTQLEGEEVQEALRQLSKPPTETDLPRKDKNPLANAILEGTKREARRHA